ALAVTSPSRAPMASDVPSVLGLGHKKMVAENFLGISAPAGMPAAVVARLHAAVNVALANATVQKRLEDLAVYGRKMSPAEFTAFVQNQVTEWAEPVKASGAKLN